KDVERLLGPEFVDRPRQFGGGAAKAISLHAPGHVDDENKRSSLAFCAKKTGPESGTASGPVAAPRAAACPASRSRSVTESFKLLERLRGRLFRRLFQESRGGIGLG